MRQIFDTVLLQHYLNQYHIPSFFDTTDLPFQLWEYAPGEMMNLLHKPEEYLKFVVAGSFQICEVRSDGSWYPLLQMENQFVLLGDMEFCGYWKDNHYQQVTQQVLTVELPLHQLHPVLMNDCTFLRYLLGAFCGKLAQWQNALDGCTLEEKLLHYLRTECPQGTLTAVEDTASRLHYSRSQLQRVLRDLTQRGILLRVKKGQYRLVESEAPRN